MKVDESSPAWRLTSLVTVVSLILTACASNTLMPTATSTSIPATQTPTSTPEPTPTPSVAPPEAHGDTLDQALLDEVWNSEHIKAQKAQWENWIRYWLGATTPPILTDTKELRYELLTDPSDAPQGANDPRLNEKVVLLLAWQDPADPTKTVRAFFPVNTIDGGFQTEPPTIEGSYEIAAGTGPLWLSDGVNRPLAWMGNDFVRLDPVLGLAREVMDKEGNWAPAYGVETVKPEAYTPEMWEQIANSPTVLKDNLPLTKGFAAGPFADRMMYFGAGNEVKAVYDPEKDTAHPAMMMNSGKMLVVNKRGRHEMLLNPLTPDAPDVVHILPEYWRWRVCNIKSSMPGDLQEVNMGREGKECRVFLNPFINISDNVVPGQYISLFPDMPILIEFQADQGDTFPTSIGPGDVTPFRGIRFSQTGRRLDARYYRMKGEGTTSPESQLARDVEDVMLIFLYMIKDPGNFWGGNEPFFEKYLVNYSPYRAGRNYKLDAPVPVIYGRQLKIAD